MLLLGVCGVSLYAVWHLAVRGISRCRILLCTRIPPHAPASHRVHPYLTAFNIPAWPLRSRVHTKMRVNNDLCLYEAQVPHKTHG